MFFVHFPQLESSKKLSEIKSLHDKIRVSTEEARKKEDAYKQLVTTMTEFMTKACYVFNEKKMLISFFGI